MNSLKLILSLPKLISNRSCLPYNTILLESFANSRPWLKTNRSWIILWYIKQLHHNYFSAKQWHKLCNWIMTFFCAAEFYCTMITIILNVVMHPGAEMKARVIIRQVNFHQVSQSAPPCPHSIALVPYK